MKKILILFLSVVYILIGNIIVINAVNNKTTYWDDAHNYNYTTNIIEEKEIGNATKFIHDSGYVQRNGMQIDQEVYMMFQKSNSEEGVKIVSWGGYNENHTVSTAIPRMTLSKIAEDYEKNHPGWKVLGGINADQYCWGYGPEISSGYDLLENRPYYPMKADGEYWFSHNFQGGNANNVVGFLNDGTNQLVYNPEAASLDRQFMLSVYDESMNLINKFNVNDLNPKSKISGEYTYVYALTDTGNNSLQFDRQKESKNKDISSSNDLYVISNADKTWVSNSVDYGYFKNESNSNSVAINSFFGKGKIEEITKNTTITATQFAVETTNAELLKLLKKGSYVVAQYEFYGGYENCESAIGWHTAQRLNGVDQNVGGSYNTRGYPRSVVGVTNDGQVALITVQGVSKGGPTAVGLYAQEINALCKAYDIKTAFQMDGGGSVTMIMRNEKGGFDTVNTPSDGNDRSIGNGLFFVVKDTQAEIKPTKITEQSIELDVNVLEYGKKGTVSNTYINLYGKTKSGKDFNALEEVKDGKVKFDGLDSNIEYYYKVQYKLEGSEELIDSYSSSSVLTAKKSPSIKEVRVDLKDETLQVSVAVKDDDKSIVGFMKISFDGGETWNNIQPGGSLKLKDFTGDPLNNIIIEYKYDINDGTEGYKITDTKFDLKYSITVFMDSLLNGYNQFVSSCFK